MESVRFFPARRLLLLAPQSFRYSNSQDAKQETILLSGRNEIEDTNRATEPAATALSTSEVQSSPSEHQLTPTSPKTPTSDRPRSTRSTTRTFKPTHTATNAELGTTPSSNAATYVPAIYTPAIACITHHGSPTYTPPDPVQTALDLAGNNLYDPLVEQHLSFPSFTPPARQHHVVLRQPAENFFHPQSTRQTLPPPSLPPLGLPSPGFSCGYDMATGFQRMSGDARRYPSSNFNNRSENRPPMSNILCRNGPQCRKFAEGTCSYNHDFSGMPANGLNLQKKSLNVDSPSFMPSVTPKSTNAQPARMGISPKAAAAAAFTPRGSGSVTPANLSHSKEPSGEFIPQQAFQPAQQFNEFIPGQNFVSQQLETPGQMQTQMSAFADPFLAQTGIAGLDGAQAQLNPYAQQTQGINNQPFFSDATNYKHPLNYHLYASIGPRRENLMAYQRSTSDFFIPDNLREDLQRKAEATSQTYANTTLPQSVEYFHSLVALDTNNQKGTAFLGYPSWVYKAKSSRDGHTYALRRIEGFRLTNEAAIRTVQSWKRISSASLVQVHDAFTGRWFNDSSLIVVTDYHPLSKTMADIYFAHGRGAGRASGQIVPENELWSYIVQLASALKSIHEGGQAAQTVTPSKVLVTSKNRVRLNGCGVIDIVQYEQRRPTTDAQRTDLEDLGKLILGIAARNQTAHHNIQKALDLVSRSYSERLRACLAWLVMPPATTPDGQGGDVQQLAEYNVNTLFNNIADKVVAVFDSTLHLEDDLTANMMRELENGRLVRLLTKMNVILERPESSSGPGAQPSNPGTLNQPSSAWSETGERFYLKLFRDYVFHQVDLDGRPILDLGHIVTCLNKLDAGIDEKIQLVDRDEQHLFIVSYREIKRGFESAWTDLSKASNASRR